MYMYVYMLHQNVLCFTPICIYFLLYSIDATMCTQVISVINHRLACGCNTIIIGPPPPYIHTRSVWGSVWVRCVYIHEAWQGKAIQTVFEKVLELPWMGFDHSLDSPMYMSWL